MTCQGSGDTVTRYLKREKGVAQVLIDWKGGSGVVVIDSEVTNEEDVLRNRVFEGHYSAKLAEQSTKCHIEDKEVLNGHAGGTPP